VLGSVYRAQVQQREPQVPEWGPQVPEWGLELVVHSPGVQP